MRARAVLLLLFIAVETAGAEVVLKGVDWQLALQVRKKKGDYHDVKRWLFPPTQQAKIRARAMALLKNNGNKDETAVLLRVAFITRLRKIGAHGEGVWTVPFHVEEKRVTTLRRNSETAVSLPINRVALDAYLKRMHRAGYWPDAFKVQVMVEPREGEEIRSRMGESVLPVVWRPGSGADASGEEGGEAK